MTSYMYECTGGHDGPLQAPKRAANTLLTGVQLFIILYNSADNQDSYLAKKVKYYSPAGLL